MIRAGRIMVIPGDFMGVRVRAPASAAGFYDDFSGATPRAEWTTLLGTLATNSGALRATALASEGYNRVSNPEFTSNTTGWTAGGAGGAIARVDSTVTPGTGSGGADVWALRVTNGGVAAYGYQSIVTMAGAGYIFSCRAYAPSANTQPNATRQTWVSAVGGSAEDTWQTLSGSMTATGTVHTMYLFCLGATVGDVTYYDAINAQFQLSGLTYNLGKADAIVTASMISPAALTTPRALYLRGSDALNYVCLRLAPNTAGTDTVLETVTAGVRATVASADVDWTAGGTDQVRVTISGNDYTVEHKKSGAGSWTTAITTSTASFNTNTLFGPMVWAAADNSWDDILIQ